MKITNKLIKSLNPCQHRLDNYLKFYAKKSHTKAQFMGLKNITHEDKVWVSLRLIPKDNIRLATADIAESVLHIFEKAYPNDDRPRKAIEAARSNSSDTAIYASAAYAAARAAASAGSYVASYVAAQAATADHAAYVAAQAATAASAGSYAASYAASVINAVYPNDKIAQQKLIRKIILKYWR